MIEVASATGMMEGDFWRKSALGLSLERLAEGDKRLVARIGYENATGLPELSKTCIEAADTPDVLALHE